MRPGTRRRLALSLATAALLLVLLELGAALALRADSADSREPLREQQHCEYDADLGWMNLPDVRIEDLYGPGTSYTTNSQRLRAPRDYTPEVPAGRHRVLCLGDSFTMGYGVDDADTFPAQLETLSPGLEVINMGLGGFGVDQDYLWYQRDGAALETDALLFCVVVADFRRMTTALFQGTYPKPTLALERGQLTVHNVPVPRGFQGPARSPLDHLSLVRLLRRRAVDRSPAADDPLPIVPVSEHLFEELQRTSRARGRHFALVLLPSERRLREPPTPVERWLEEFTRRAGIPFLNLFPRMRRIDRGELPSYFTQRHYSPRGNQLVAEALLGLIESERRN